MNDTDSTQDRRLTTEQIAGCEVETDMQSMTTARASGAARRASDSPAARALAGRRAECTVLDGLVEAVRAGESRVLVVHGEPGWASRRCWNT
jgi:hypothetical protein